MVDQMTLQTISVVIAAASVVIGVINSIYSSRIAEKQRQTQIDSRQAQLFMQIYNQFTMEKYKQLIEVNSWEWKDYDDFTEKIWRP